MEGGWNGNGLYRCSGGAHTNHVRQLEVALHDNPAQLRHHRRALPRRLVDLLLQLLRRLDRLTHSADFVGDLAVHLGLVGELLDPRICDTRGACT